MRENRADVLIIGGGLGGCAAALAVAEMGLTAILTEETDWIGGQLTSQGVPPDEHGWIERVGATRRYQRFRHGVRAYYKRNYPLTPAARAQWNLNPGNATGSRVLSHEPRVAVAVLHEMLAPHQNSGRLQLFLRHRPIAADVSGDRVRSIRLLDTTTGDERVVTGDIVLDATELGDLLPLTGTEYVTGSESRDETGEPHAHEGPARPLNMQSFTYCMAVDYLPGEDHTIDRPAQYDFWRTHVPDLNPAWSGPLLSWTYSNPRTLEPASGVLFQPQPGQYDFWRYRRIIDQANFSPGTYRSDITILNLPQMDYCLGPICEVEPEEVERHLFGAKQLSLSFLYWLQTEAPRHDGGTGYPGLRLRKDVLDTPDGLAKYPYVRESRRIQAQFTVLEHHVGREARVRLGGKDSSGAVKAARFEDSVGIGSYHIDLHPSCGGDNYIDFSSLPFQIPLGSLIPVRMRNLLAANKNLGVTHLTNGCYRLHPVEWNIGEAAGHLAEYALQHRIDPQAVRTPKHLGEYQRLLRAAGIDLEWPNIGP